MRPGPVAPVMGRGEEIELEAFIDTIARAAEFTALPVAVTRQPNVTLMASTDCRMRPSYTQAPLATAAPSEHADGGTGVDERRLVPLYVSMTMALPVVGPSTAPPFVMRSATIGEVPVSGVVMAGVASAGASARPRKRSLGSPLAALVAIVDAAYGATDDMRTIELEGPVLPAMKYRKKVPLSNCPVMAEALPT
jgi:hypothetical protein